MEEQEYLPTQESEDSEVTPLVDQEEEKHWIAHSNKDTSSYVLPRLLTEYDKKLIDILIKIFGQFESKVHFTEVSDSFNLVQISKPKKNRKK